MNDFTATNGVTLKFGEQGHIFIPPVVTGLGDETQQALREYFQHERDEELGRWRYPIDPDYVVYLDAGTIYVLRESGGGEVGIRWFDASNRKKSRRSPDVYHAAAAAYLEARPERKPWEDAKPNEAWALTVDGVEYPWGVGDGVDAGRFVYLGGLSNLPLDHPSITAGRRIWPEGVAS